MLRTAKSLKGATIAATDGDIGSVHDLYFDDRTWTIRYFVVDTGTWLPGRRVLISPISVKPSADPNAVAVRLTKRQVEESPSVDTDRPVNRQYEQEYSRYYGYPYYWTGPYRWGATPYPGEMALAGVPITDAPVVEIPVSEAGDPTLRSARDVMEYYIEAADGDIGHVEDFVVDDQEWAIRYMIVDTRNWWPGKQVLVSPEWINNVRWADSRVSVDLTKDGVKGAPEYDPDQPLERDYENRLHRHYGRATYWR
jgi:hypothetical protein